MKKVFIGVLAALMLFAFVACDNQATGSAAAVTIYSEDCPVYVAGQKANLADWTIKGVDVYGNIVSVSASDLKIADAVLANGQTTVKATTPWGIEATLDVKVLPVTAIEVDAEEAKDEYIATVGSTVADEFKKIDSTDVVVTATYTDEDGVSQELVVDNALCDFAIADWSKAGDTVVTVTYASKTDTYPVVLKSNYVTRIEVEVDSEYSPIASSSTVLDTTMFKTYGIYENGQREVLVADTDVNYSIQTDYAVADKTYGASSGIKFTEAKTYTVYAAYVGDENAEGINRYANGTVTVIEDYLKALEVTVSSFTVNPTFDYETTYPSEIVVKAVYAGSTSPITLSAKTDYTMTPLKKVAADGLKTGDRLTFTISPTANGQAKGLDPVSFQVVIGTAYSSN